VIITNILVKALLDLRVAHNRAFLSADYGTKVSVNQNSLLQKTAQ